MCTRWLEMSKAVSNLLKHIDKLSYIDKEQMFQWMKRYVEPSCIVGDKMREARFNEGFECPHCNSEHVNRFGKTNEF